MEETTPIATERFASLFTRIFAPNALAAIPEGEKGYDPMQVIIYLFLYLL